MIRHVVMWKFRPDTNAQQDAFLDALQNLQGVIPQLLRCEVGSNVKDGNYDAVLIADFASLDALAQYQQDPRHQAVSALCQEIRESRTAVDFEC